MCESKKNGSPPPFDERGRGWEGSGKLSQNKKLDMLALIQFPLPRKTGVSISGDPVNAKPPEFELPCFALKLAKTVESACLGTPEQHRSEQGLRA